MGTCELCDRSGENLSLREATHKDLGKKWVCGECWTSLFEKNRMVSGTAGSGFSCAGGCSGCRHA